MRKKKEGYFIHLSGLEAVAADSTRKLLIHEMANFTRKSWAKFYNICTEIDFSKCTLIELKTQKAA